MSLRTLALVCFFLSGATGLLYEVLWTRLFGVVIGNTHFSITVVVSVFMGGLALGSWIGGRLADRSRNPLRLYGFLNLAGALLCGAVPFLITIGEPLFGWLYRFHDGDPEAPALLLARLGFSALLILAPTTCMGATLPALSRFFARKLADVGFTVGRLYAVNTFGAVVGVFLAGFWSIEHLGVRGTTIVAVGIDVVIGLVVIALSRGAEEPIGAAPAGATEPVASGVAAPAASAKPPAEPRTRLPAAVRLAVWAFGLSGFANMALQIAWTKAIVLTIGNSTYAFSLIVTLFILGIGIGGGAMTLVVDRLRRPQLALGIVLLATSVLSAASVPLLGRFPIWGARAFDAVAEPSYGAFLRIQIGMVAVVILPATTGMGMVFPLVGRIRTLAVERVGSAVGSAYFANTLGSILGTLAAGFLFVPLFGAVYWTIWLAALIGLSTGSAVALTAPGAPARSRLVPVAAALLLVLAPAWVLRPHGVLGSTGDLWHPAIFSRGAYVYYRGAYYRNRLTREVVPAEEFVRALEKGNRVLWYREGIHAPVAVVRSPKGDIALRISGKVEASLAAGGGYNRDLPHQVMAGHLAMVLHPNPREVLTLGLGGGVTLGTLTLYPVERVDSLEISPEVIEAARRFFSKANRGALGDHPRVPVRSIIGDGRNHLLYTTRRYDVITSVPSNPWIAGIGNLFSVEFFRICRQRLRPGGVLCNWIHKINMRSQDMRTVVRTFVSVFGENAQLWDLGFDCLLIGSDRPVRFDPARLSRLLEVEEIRADLASLGITDARTFLRHFRMDGRAMAAYAGQGPLNSDADPVLEFSCPRGLYGHSYDAYRSMAETEPTPITDALLASPIPEAARSATALREAFRHLQFATAEVDYFASLRQALETARAAGRSGLDLSPAEQQRILRLSETVFEHFSAIRKTLAKERDPWLAERALAQAHAAFGGRGNTLAEVLATYWRALAARARSPADRLELLERALDLASADQRLFLELARLYMKTSQAARGFERLAPLVKAGESDPSILQGLALLRGSGGDVPGAEALFRRALDRANGAKLRAEIRANLGYVYRAAGRLEEARRELDEALRLDPENAAARAQRDALEGK